jgi:hypothetical protein
VLTSSCGHYAAIILWIDLEAPHIHLGRQDPLVDMLCVSPVPVPHDVLLQLVFPIHSISCRPWLLVRLADDRICSVARLYGPCLDGLKTPQLFTVDRIAMARGSEDARRVALE